MLLLLQTTIFFFFIIINHTQALPSSLTLGFLGPTNLPNIKSQTGGYPALFAFKLAIRDINNRHDILPNTNLTFVNNDTNANVGNATIQAFWQCTHANVIGIVGEYYSSGSQSVQYVSRYYKVPQISYGSTAIDFTILHSTEYPYFLRTTPSQDLESVALARLISSQGWKNIALITATDALTYRTVEVLTQEAQKLNITIVASTSFASGTTNLTTQIQTIKQSQARIIVFIGTISDQQTVVNCSLEEGLTGIGYQWIGMHGGVYRQLYLDSNNQIIQPAYQWSQGLLGTRNFADVDSNIYKEYAQRWAATPFDSETTSVDPQSMISPIANFAYDATFMFAYALHKMIEEFHLDPMEMENRQLFLETLKNVSFQGVSGHVSVDQNGDRTAPFDIVNFQGDQIVRVGSVNIDDQVDYFPNVTILYTGGTETKPRDMPLRPLIKLSRSVIIGMIVGSIICTIICFILICFTCYFKQHAVIKASSPTFLILMLIGVISLSTSIIPRALENSLRSLACCISEIWLSNIGYLLVIGTLLIKTYRLWIIFRMSEHVVKHHLKDKYLLMILFGLIFVLSLPLIGLCVGDRLYLQLSAYDSTSDYEYCSSNHHTHLYIPVTMSIRFSLLLLTAICAYKIRKIPNMFNETRQLVFTIYNLLFLSITLPTIDLTMDRGKDATMIAYGLCKFLICMLTSLIVFVPKIILVIKMGDKKECSSSTFTYNLKT